MPDQHKTETKTPATAGTLGFEEYAKRRSPILLAQADAQLQSVKEIDLYFQRQPSAHIAAVTALADLGQPMNPACRLIIMLVAYGEESSIGQTLELYSRLDIPPEAYEIIVLDNRPAHAAADNTAAEVAKFRAARPDINLVFAQKQWQTTEPATVGNARRWAADIAQIRILRGLASDWADEMVMVTTDADILSLADNYASAILGEFQRRPKLDALALGRFYPTEVLAKPNAALPLLVWDALDETVAHDLAQPPESRVTEPANLVGHAGALRPAIYAAVGGFNPDAVIVEDVEMSWLISDARGWDPQRITHLAGAYVCSNPRRMLQAVVGQTPVINIHGTFVSDETIRSLDWRQLAELVPDRFDWGQAQNDIDEFWQAGSQVRSLRFGLNYKYRQNFQKALAGLGLVCRIDDGHAVLEDVDGFLQRQYPARQIEISRPGLGHPDPPEPGMIAMFKSIPRGVVGSRSAKAADLLTAWRQAAAAGSSERAQLLHSLYRHYLVR